MFNSKTKEEIFKSFSRNPNPISDTGKVPTQDLDYKTYILNFKSFEIDNVVKNGW